MSKYRCVLTETKREKKAKHWRTRGEKTEMKKASGKDRERKRGGKENGEKKAARQKRKGK
jgi:hypothetical protein